MAIFDSPPDSPNFLENRAGEHLGAHGISTVVPAPPPSDLLFIPGANGDAIPDGEPTILLDGWAAQDTPAGAQLFVTGGTVAIGNGSFGSLHASGGAVFLMGDGAVRTVSDYINLDIFRQMASRNGGETINAALAE